MLAGKTSSNGRGCHRLALVLRGAGLPSLLALVLAVWADTVSAASLHLVMVEDPGCIYCRRWHEEVGPGYPKSDEGKAAPLVRLQKGAAALGAFKPVKYTPTFILVRDGREIDRLVGYPGADGFWTEIAAMLARAGAEPPSTAPPQGTATDIRFVPRPMPVLR